ncbi:MAG TPA: hypothetical protein VNH64_06695 [Parvularculaceae bacterium]|nr:hypothetical protein [Parvularculaceae bacterium]
MQRKQIATADNRLADQLLDELLDAPDDFHHFTERRLFRRLWFRLGRFLPRYFDLDEMHRERRAARDAAASLRGSRSLSYWRGCGPCEALSKLCRLVRAQTETEEAEFYPLLRTKLTRSDWSEIEEEIRAFEACSRSLRDRRLHS